MDDEVVMLLAWVVLPLVVSVAARLVIGWRERRAPVAPPFDPALRLEQLRTQRELNHRVKRGRMAEAMRLAESSAPTMALQVGHR